MKLKYYYYYFYYYYQYNSPILFDVIFYINKYIAWSNATCHKMYNLN